jgi:hypothetical protein
MRSSEQITVGALAIKEVIRKERMAFLIQSQGFALLTAERAEDARSVCSGVFEFVIVGGHPPEKYYQYPLFTDIFVQIS